MSTVIKYIIGTDNFFIKVHFKRIKQHLDVYLINDKL